MLTRVTRVTAVILVLAVFAAVVSAAEDAKLNEIQNTILEKDEFLPDEDIYIKALDLPPVTWYATWIQPNPVDEGD